MSSIASRYDVGQGLATPILPLKKDGFTISAQATNCSAVALDRRKAARTVGIAA